MIEMYRAFVPVKHIINDNHGQHYKIHEGNLEWLTAQFNRIKNNGEDLPGNFQLPSLDIFTQLEYPISIRCEVWRCTNRIFDPHNYAKTFKAPLDLLVSNGYIKDDNWKYVNGITYTGGGSSVWKERAIRYNNDGLPDEITPEWWNKYSDNYGDIFIRIFIS